jgi:SAM-dependent methyltransferase
MERKYYEAYDDRYRQIHEKNLQWFYDEPTVIVHEIMDKYKINRNHKLLELGCGEGRDAFPILNTGFDLIGTDISTAAIQYCRNKFPEFAERFQVLDCVAGELDEKFDFIYAVAVVHMLVPDADRNAFYNFICDHLSPNGIALICTMGDGKMERQTDIRTAFDLQKRTHEQTGFEVNVASTSCRMVSFSSFEEELKHNGLEILEKGITNAAPDFPMLMYVVVNRESL